MGLVFGGSRFPLVATVGGAIPQPFTDAYLPYLKDAINAYCGAAFAATMKGKFSGPSGDLACQEIGIVDPGFQLTKTTFRTPYLALYVESGTTSEETMRWDAVETKYALAYVLPPLPVETIQHVAVPFLKALVGLLVLLFKAGGDASHDAGARVDEASGITAVRMGQWQIVAETLGDDMRTAQAFPMLRAEVFVREQEGYDDGNGEDLAGIDASIDVASSDGIDPDTVQITHTPALAETPRVGTRTEKHHDRPPLGSRGRSHVLARPSSARKDQADWSHARARRLVDTNRRGHGLHARRPGRQRGRVVPARRGCRRPARRC